MSYSELSVEVRRMLHAPLTPVYEEESFNIKDIEEKEDLFIPDLDCFFSRPTLLERHQLTRSKPLLTQDSYNVSSYLSLTSGSPPSSGGRWTTSDR
jgi:hypothetical protein